MSEYILNILLDTCLLGGDSVRKAKYMLSIRRRRYVNGTLTRSGQLASASKNRRSAQRKS